MAKRGLVSLYGIVILTVGLLVATFVAGNEPLLGLDLQGGVSVVLQPAEPADSDQLDQAIDIIRRRIDSLGVAEPEISRQGDTILVQIPGVENQERVLDLVGQTAELRFRPVLNIIPADPESVDPSTATTVPGDTTTTAPTDSTATTVAPDTTLGPTTVPGETGLGPLTEGESAAGTQDPTTTVAPTSDTGAPATTVAPEAATTGDTTATTLAPGTTPEITTAQPPEVTEAQQDEADQEVVLPDRNDPNLLYQLGPTALTGDALETANASLNPQGQWVVLPTFRGGETGIDLFNQVAALCFAKDPSCPTGALAITLDGEVISAPSIGQANFDRDAIEISGDFTEGDAKDLALVLRYGALPVELEPQQTQLVSATIGEDALRAGVIAGLVGLFVITLYLLIFYRLLGVVAIASLAVATGLLWVVIAYLGETRGLALTLAGVTGIIVSIGVAVDSNVVYYEQIKEGVRSGRTLRSAAERSFNSAFSTIVKADVASLIGAGVLYFLTVGPVRGFAFYLGLATLLDLIAAWFFMRPLVIRLTRTKLADRKPGWFGFTLPAVPMTAPEPEPVGAGR